MRHQLPDRSLRRAADRVSRAGGRLSIHSPAGTVPNHSDFTRRGGRHFPDQRDARKFLSCYRALRLTPEVAYAAARIDRELMTTGGRLGENDNWIAAFCRYYGQPIISRDRAFDRVGGLRRLAY